MYLLLIFFILFIISAALAFLLKYRFEQTVAVTCFGIIFVLYLLGLAGIMSTGFYFIIAVSALAFGLLVFNVFKGSINKNFLLNNVFTPGFAVFCIFFGFICYVHSGRILTFWDEFSHWGLVVKNMYIFDAFGNHPDATTLFRGYPPSTALFQYFWMQPGGYQEANLYRALGVFSFSLLLPTLKNVGWKNVKTVPFIALFLVMVPMYIFYDFYIEIYVDAILGILFAYILFMYFTEKSFNISFYINLILALFILTLVKASGFGLALTAAFIIICDQIITVRRAIKENKKININRDLINDVKTDRSLYNRMVNIFRSKLFCISAAAILSPIAANQSWSIYRQLTDTGHAWGGIRYLTVPAVIELLTGRGDSNHYAIIDSYITTFLSRIIYIGERGFSYAHWTLIILIIIFIWLRKVDNPLRSKLINCSIGVLAGWILYNISLILLYVFTFPLDVAAILASYNRYINTYLTAVVCLFSLLFIYYNNENEKIDERKKFIRTVVFLVVALVNFYFLPAVDLLRNSDPGVRANVTVNRLSSLSLDYRTDRVYYIFQSSHGFEHFIAYYELTPVKGSPWLHWSIGTPRYDGDVWTTDITADEWSDMLRQDFTYVYLEHTDDLFIEEFGELFDDPDQIRNRSLFRVTERAGKVVLIYVEI